jgi:hypothetical protein
MYGFPVKVAFLPRLFSMSQIRNRSFGYDLAMEVSKHFAYIWYQEGGSMCMCNSIGFEAILTNLTRGVNF